MLPFAFYRMARSYHRNQSVQYLLHLATELRTDRTMRSLVTVLGPHGNASL
jgi:hypothetical protein